MIKVRIWFWFWTGHCISKVMEWTARDDKFNEWLYDAYNWCMSRSSDLDTDQWMWKSVK